MVETLNNKTKIVCVLVFLMVQFLFFSFPFQVLTGSVYVSLIPYVLLFLAFIVKNQNINNIVSTIVTNFRCIDGYIFAYSIWVIAISTYQYVYGIISIYEAITSLVIFLLPTSMYYYFTNVASALEVKYFLASIAVAGILGAIYFSYDNYSMLVLGKVLYFSEAAHQYSIDQSGLPAEVANIARVNAGSRGVGLMESRAVSSSWIVLGCIAFLSLVPTKYISVRRVIMLGFLIYLLYAMALTSIICFLVIVAIIEIKVHLHKNNKLRGKHLAYMSIGGILFSMYVYSTVNENIITYFIHIMSDQLSILTSFGREAPSIVSMIFGTLGGYFEYIQSNPITILTGDGFSNYGFVKGGDVGIAVTISRFGLFLYILVVAGIASIIYRSIKLMSYVIKKTERDVLCLSNTMQFCMGVVVLVFISDFHYSIWAAKSILPIIFFALAIYRKYSYV